MQCEIINGDISMEFCEKCGGLLIPHKSGKSITLVCRSCGKKKVTKLKKEFKVKTTTNKNAEKIVVLDKKSKFETLPVTRAQCPKCENTQAFWWMQQTRSIDEPSTRFYRCTRCKHTWREYE